MLPHESVQAFFGKFMLILSRIDIKSSMSVMGFPDSSVGQKSTCNAGDPSSIPVSGRSTGEEVVYPFQYSWAFLVAQLVKNPSVMWETWV